MELFIVFDNEHANEHFISGWGYSVYLAPLGLLFDTGSETASLLHNLRLFEISLDTLNTIFLSHFHWDHTGGLLGLLPGIKNTTVVLHQGFSKKFVAEISRLGGKIKEINSPSQLTSEVYSTGCFPKPIPEAGLVLETEKHLVLLTGCAHPGILFMAQETKRLFGRPPSLLMGGFHLLNKTGAEILAIAHELKRLGVTQVAPSHCTGKKALAIFADVFGDGFLKVGAGTKLLVD
ncbi:metal-dependent hydrolase of the beta-lactamase superfamily [Thermodesulfatator indicus DSM 15286]|uniref:Metal-dependent hydrolase of the beta-lactamase superfamily n=1 Tax=Thermodesulfatator indicus (strain DSM 15286 / JCM 11887 / CIR29812) TaxID=667014 RepID=F8A8S4_THEID|nr:MBL fold metallo-hydrolase [Thermodesulfatator indicus]AEH44971.1 metal-dependent hydrolase of the beta-lactamase superfamily [Thermodesulfatator indicus DSM 15286]